MRNSIFNIIFASFLFSVYSCSTNPKDTKESPEDNDTIQTDSTELPEVYKESESRYLISGEVDNAGYYLPDVKVAVFSDWIMDTFVFTNDTGYFELNDLPINKNYSIYFSKKGHITKFCLLKSFTDEELDSTGEFPLSINTTLLSEKYYQTTKLKALRSEPSAIGSYNKQIDNIEWDLKQIEEYKLKLEQAKKDNNQ